MNDVEYTERKIRIDYLYKGFTSGFLVGLVMGFIMLGIVAFLALIASDYL